MKKLAALLVLLPSLALAQLPPSGGIVINQTTVQGGSANQCLYIASGKVGSQACGAGTAANIQVGTTTVGGGTSSYILYNNAGVLGNLQPTGTGLPVLASSPTITTPLIASLSGGSAASSTLTLQSTTGAGTTDSIVLKTGSQVTAITVDTNQQTFLTGTSAVNFQALQIENLSTADNTTKTVSLSYYGRDTINTRKLVGQILVTPSESNWAGGGVGGISFLPETGNGSVSETVRMLHAGGLTVGPVTAVPAGGTAGLGLMFSSATNFGVFFGSGAPTLAAAQGSLYLRSDGTGVADRAYINTDGGTTWTAISTAG